jgi:hypothetical protein
MENITMLEINLDQDKFLKFLRSLTLQRFSTLESLKDYFYNKTSIKVILEKNENNENSGDFSLIDNCTVNGEDLCYITLFYIIDNKGCILITDYYYDFL